MLKNFLYNAPEVIILPIYNAPLLKIDVEGIFKNNGDTTDNDLNGNDKQEER